MREVVSASPQTTFRAFAIVSLFTLALSVVWGLIGKIATDPYLHVFWLGDFVAEQFYQYPSRLDWRYFLIVQLDWLFLTPIILSFNLWIEKKVENRKFSRVILKSEVFKGAATYLLVLLILFGLTFFSAINSANEMPYFYVGDDYFSYLPRPTMDYSFIAPFNIRYLNIGAFIPPVFSILIVWVVLIQRAINIFGEGITWAFFLVYTPLTILFFPEALALISGENFANVLNFVIFFGFYFLTKSRLRSAIVIFALEISKVLFSPEIPKILSNMFGERLYFCRLPLQFSAFQWVDFDDKNFNPINYHTELSEDVIGRWQHFEPLLVLFALVAISIALIIRASKDKFTRPFGRRRNDLT